MVDPVRSSTAEAEREGSSQGSPHKLAHHAYPTLPCEYPRARPPPLYAAQAGSLWLHLQSTRSAQSMWMLRRAAPTAATDPPARSPQEEARKSPAELTHAAGEPGTAPCATKPSQDPGDQHGSLRLHTDHMVEPGAHAGSKTERLSVHGMTQMIAKGRPRGVAIAIRYARAAYSPEAIAQTDMSVTEAMRRFVAETGIQAMPRCQSWAAVTQWASGLCSSPERADAPAALLQCTPLRTETALPEAVDQAAAISAAQNPETVCETGEIDEIDEEA